MGKQSYNSIHVDRNNSQYTFQCMENQENTMKDTVFFYFDGLPFNDLKQIAEMKTPDPICRKTVFLTFIIASMLPEIIHKIIFSVWKSKETL